MTGVGPPARLEALPAAFAMASRALQTAVAFGEEGAFSLADLSIRPAILADEALGDAFAARYLEPLAGLGRLGAELEDDAARRGSTRGCASTTPPARCTCTRTRCATGCAGSRRRRGPRCATPRDLVELWWALERRRLAG